MVAAGTLTFGDVQAQFENWSQDLTGLNAADNGWFPAAIYGQFIASRASDIVEEQLKDKNKVNKFVQQTIGCLEFELVPIEECPCAPPSGCTWYKTALPLPPIIGDMVSLTAIGGNLEKLFHVTLRDWTAIKFSLHSRVKAERERPYGAIRNNYLYVYDRKILRAAAVGAIFYDPVETQRFPACGLTPTRCDNFEDYGLFIDPGKYQKLMAATFQLITGMKNGTVLDTTNNAQPAAGIEPSVRTTLR